MAGLAQAVGDLFARIAAALASSGGFGQPAGSVKGYIPQPSPPPVSPPGTVTPPPLPPGTGTPSPPIDRVVDVPTTNLFPVPSPGDTREECPLFSPSQYLQFVGLQTKAQDAGVTIALPATIPQGSTQDMNAISVVGIPVEFDDLFRFRAFGSAGALTVSFFGRVANAQGQITPFNHPVPIDGTGTVFETTPRPGPGFLLDSAASVPIGAIITGSVNAVGEIGRMVNGAFVPHTLLFAGQISDQVPLSSSLASPPVPTANPTFFEVDAAGGVGFNVDVPITVTSGRKARIISVLYTFVASAAAGSRFMCCALESGSIFVWRANSHLVLTANLRAQLWADIGGNVNVTFVALGGYINIGNTPIPPDVYFTGTVHLICFTNTSIAGDIISAVKVVYEES